MQRADDANDSGEDVRAVIARTAALARLEVTEAEVDRLADELTRILSAFSRLAELDLEEEEEEEGRAETTATRTRSDEPVVSGLGVALLASAPEEIDGFFGVPKTIDDGA